MPLIDKDKFRSVVDIDDNWAITITRLNITIYKKDVNDNPLYKTKRYYNNIIQALHYYQEQVMRESEPQSFTEVVESYNKSRKVLEEIRDELQEAKVDWDWLNE